MIISWYTIVFILKREELLFWLVLCESYIRAKGWLISGLVFFSAVEGLSMNGIFRSWKCCIKFVCLEHNEVFRLDMQNTSGTFSLLMFVVRITVFIIKINYKYYTR
jgi:hypothetical protein